MIKTSARVAAWLLVAFIVYSTLSPISLRPETGEPAYLERFAAFFALGVGFGVGYPKRRIWIALALLFGACVLEASQNLVPTRHGRPLDALEKSLGAMAGLLSSIVIGRLTAALDVRLNEFSNRNG